MMRFFAFKKLEFFPVEGKIYLIIFIGFWKNTVSRLNSNHEPISLIPTVHTSWLQCERNGYSILKREHLAKDTYPDCI